MVGNPSKGPGGAQSQVQSRASLRPRAGGAVVRPKVDSESGRDGAHALTIFVPKDKNRNQVRLQ